MLRRRTTHDPRAKKSPGRTSRGPVTRYRCDRREDGRFSVVCLSAARAAVRSPLGGLCDDGAHSPIPGRVPAADAVPRDRPRCRAGQLSRLHAPVAAGGGLLRRQGQSGAGNHLAAGPPRLFLRLRQHLRDTGLPSPPARPPGASPSATRSRSPPISRPLTGWAWTCSPSTLPPNCTSWPGPRRERASIAASS